MKDRRTRKAEQARTPYASNWRTVLGVDAGFGLLVLLAGLIVLFSVNVFIGAGIGAFAVCYLVIIYRRYRYWAELRRDAGLDT